MQGTVPHPVRPNHCPNLSHPPDNSSHHSYGRYSTYEGRRRFLRSWFRKHASRRSGCLQMMSAHTDTEMPWNILHIRQLLKDLHRTPRSVATDFRKGYGCCHPLPHHYRIPCCRSHFVPDKLAKIRCGAVILKNIIYICVCSIDRCSH